MDIERDEEEAGPDPGARRKRALDVARSVLEGEADPIVGMATIASVLREHFDEWIWAGFYRIAGGELVVGPYQGHVACIRFPVDQGVCGHCATEERSVTVRDVREFPGHITCDPRAVSEAVVPVRDAAGRIVGVLDVDSDRPGAFTREDMAFLEDMADLLRGFAW